MGVGCIKVHPNTHLTLPTHQPRQLPDRRCQHPAWLTPRGAAAAAVAVAAAEDRVLTDRRYARVRVRRDRVSRPAGAGTGAVAEQRTGTAADQSQNRPRGWPVLGGDHTASSGHRINSAVGSVSYSSLKQMQTVSTNANSLNKCKQSQQMQNSFLRLE